MVPWSNVQDHFGESNHNWNPPPYRGWNAILVSYGLIKIIGEGLVG